MAFSRYIPVPARKKARKFTENRIQPAFSDQDPNWAPPHNKTKRTECGIQQAIQQSPGQKLPLPKEPGSGRQMARSLFLMSYSVSRPNVCCATSIIHSVGYRITEAVHFMSRLISIKQRDSWKIFG